jgi:hypothetical protein
LTFDVKSKRQWAFGHIGQGYKAPKQAGLRAKSRIWPFLRNPIKTTLLHKIGFGNSNQIQDESCEGQSRANSAPTNPAMRDDYEHKPTRSSGKCEQDNDPVNRKMGSERPFFPEASKLNSSLSKVIQGGKNKSRFG